MVISCALTPRTIAGRIDAIPNEGDNENEDHQADGQDTGAD